jgi:Flp pilus assembly protein TadG
VRPAHHAEGQSLVEFALVLFPLMLLLLGIIQMGLVFNGYVTLSNATREAARSASIYVYDRNLSKAQNDTARTTAARAAQVSGMGILMKTSPQLVAAEQLVTYSRPTGVPETDARAGQNVTFHAEYHLDLIIPLIAAILPLESGRLTLESEVTMIVN